MVKYKNVDGVQIQMTAEEEAAWIAYQDTPLTKLQMLMNRIRLKRNTLLDETDWWAVADRTMTDDQKKYRQDLRDITNGLDTEKKAEEVTWPTKP
jgi:hypothetical protein|tara:strand:- start:46 stop:330 length:285 start_codon:yes stop_codon:yes gene_type:complete